MNKHLLLGTLKEDFIAAEEPHGKSDACVHSWESNNSKGWFCKLPPLPHSLYVPIPHINLFSLARYLFLLVFLEPYI